MLSMRPIVAAAMLAVGVLPSGPTSVLAQTADRTCAPGQAPRFVFGFAELRTRVGDRMGTPVTCEFADPNGTGDVHQRTSSGLSFWRKSTNTPTFTDGYNHWALTTRGMVTWTGSSIDPPAATQASPSAWQGYGNTRYGFGVRFPADWPAGAESDARDGIQLYVGNPEITISTSANRNPAGTYSTAPQTGRPPTALRMDDGRTGYLWLGREGRFVVEQVIVDNGDVAATVYARVPESFFAANEATLLQVMKSLTIVSGVIG